MCVYARHGLFIRLLYLLTAMLWWLGMTAVRCVRGIRRSTVVLCYHGVRDSQRARFAWQMTRIADRTIDVVDLDAPLRPDDRYPQVLVTFDDAYANLLDNALPIMQQLEVPALIFVVPGNLGDVPRWPLPAGDADSPERHERIMAADQATAARSTLCRFGSHTQNHVNLVDVPATGRREELVQSRIQLQRMLQQNVEDLAPPFGAYNAEVLSAARAAGYKRVFTLDASPQPIAPGVIGRFPMVPDVWRLEFWLTCAGAYAWLRPWRRLLRRLRKERAVGPKKEPAFA
jgi:peptidoglycan/xylan/chitin deacetylase (PgdA/CDA1 family)